MTRAQDKATDGRHGRSVATRQRIVDALTALVYEGQLTPTAEQVAGRAQVGLRTVFRHFADMDSLYREISRDLDGLLVPHLSTRLVGQTWQERLQHAVELRAALYDQIAAVHLAAQVHRHQSAFIAGSYQGLVERQREMLRRLLPAALAQDAALFEAIDLLLGIESWVRLRREQGLGSAEARAVILRALAALTAAHERDTGGPP